MRNVALAFVDFVGLPQSADRFRKLATKAPTSPRKAVHLDYGGRSQTSAPSIRFASRPVAPHGRARQSSKNIIVVKPNVWGPPARDRRRPRSRTVCVLPCALLCRDTRCAFVHLCSAKSLSIGVRRVPEVVEMFCYTYACIGPKYLYFVSNLFAQKIDFHKCRDCTSFCTCCEDKIHNNNMRNRQTRRGCSSPHTITERQEERAVAICRNIVFTRLIKSCCCWGHLQHSRTESHGLDVLNMHIIFSACFTLTFVRPAAAVQPHRQPIKPPAFPPQRRHTIM